ncbi:MAG: (Fe-S)-binding protein [Nanobdellota archaeon]
MLQKFMQKLKRGNTLYYPGCFRFVMPELAEGYQKILSEFGYDLIDVPEFNCCGNPVLAAGYDTDFYNLAQKNKEIFKRYGVKRIISNCPACVFMFNTYYKIPTQHVSEILLQHAEHFRTANEPVSYHRSCHLRKAENDAPERLLRKVGYELVPFPDQCCGAGGGVKQNKPELAHKAAQSRLSQCRTNKVITACPQCYQHLKENASIKVMELSEVLQ